MRYWKKKAPTGWCWRPLNQDAVIEIAEDVLKAVPDADLLTLAEGGGGNPFLLVELLDGLRFSVDDLADMLDEPANGLLLALEEALTAQIVVAADELLVVPARSVAAGGDGQPPRTHTPMLHLKAGGRRC